MNNFDNEFAKWMVVGLIALAVVLFAIREPRAHHEPTHRELSVGVPSEIPVLLFVCNTRSELMQIVKAHEDGGWSAGTIVAKKLGEERCGSLIARIVVTECFYKTELLFPAMGGKYTKVTACEMIVEGMRPVPMYGILENVTFVPREILNADLV